MNANITNKICDIVGNVDICVNIDNDREIILNIKTANIKLKMPIYRPYLCGLEEYSQYYNLLKNGILSLGCCSIRCNHRNIIFIIYSTSTREGTDACLEVTIYHSKNYEKMCECIKKIYEYESRHVLVGKKEI